jgi:hypothetical protein
MTCERLDDIRNVRDSLARLWLNLIVLGPVYALGIEPLSALAVVLGCTHRHPHVPVEPEDDVHAHGATRRWEVVKVALEAAHEARCQLEKEPVPKLAVFQRTRVQRHCAVLEECLDFGDEELKFVRTSTISISIRSFTHVTLGEELAHLERVALNLAALHAAGEVDAREHEHGVLTRVGVDAPALSSDLDNTPNDQIAHLRSVPRLEGFDAHELVDALDRARDG